MHSAWQGPAWIVLFGLMQALRDVYFGGLVQGVSRFAVIALAFSLAIAVSGAVAWRRSPADFSIARRLLPKVVATNLATAIAWNAYFYGLSALQPSLVNTLHSGIGPLVVMALAAAGVSFAGPPARIDRVEALCHAGLVLALAGLWWIALDGRSGLAPHPRIPTIAALGALVVSGTAITISLLLARQLSVAGMSASGVNALRYPLIVLAAFVALAADPQPSGIAGAPSFAFLAAVSGLLVALPLYFLQRGIATTPPLTAHVLRALGPVFVFALELADGRIRYAPPVLAGIALYCGFVVGATIAHARARRTS